MPNTINNLLFSETATTVTTSTEQATKETPSLFDSLLSSATSSKETATENNTLVSAQNSEANNVKTENLKIENANDTNATSKETEVTKLDTTNQENNEKATNSMSLLDRLLIESKNDAVKGNLTTNAIDLKPNTEGSALNTDSLMNNVVNTEIKSDIENIDIPKEVAVSKEVIADDPKIIVDNTIDLNSNNEIVTVIENKEDNQKVVNNNVSSLLDKLVVEAKKDINKTTVTDSLMNNVVNTEIKSDIENIDIPKEVAVSKEVIADDPKIIVDNTIDLNSNNEIVTVIENKEDNQKVVNNNVSSLLDKLVVEAKKDINKTTVTDSLMNNVVNTEIKSDIENIDIPKEVAVSKEVIADDPKIIVDNTIDLNSNNEIVTVIENKEDNQKVVNNNVSSLLDKLVVEAKKDINKTTVTDSLMNNVVNTEIKSDIENIDIPKEVAVSKEVIADDPKIIVDNTIVLDDSVETVNVNEGLSLMDKLIQKTTQKIITTDVNNVVIDTSTKEIVSEDLITNIYLGSQKNQLNNQSLFNKKEAVTLLKEGTNVQAIKVSAEMLDLGLENIDIQQTKDNKLDIKKTTIDIVDRKNMIDSILSQKNVKSEEVRNLITQSVEASKALLENELNLAEDSVVNVNSPLSYNIQSKIIGAKQQMATVMSDIARQMYENYKPPVTAFRINLNPTELGSIAILMKSDKNSGLSISLNASNSVTLDTLMENQNVLKNSLSKTFNDSTKFNLDFSSSSENNNPSSNNQSNQQNNRRFEQQMDTQSVLKLQEENKNIEEKILDYM